MQPAKKCEGLFALICGRKEIVKPTVSGLYGLKAKLVKLYIGYNLRLIKTYY